MEERRAVAGRVRLIEGHGTSTRVGDVAEVTSLSEAFAGARLDARDRSRSAR